MHESQDRTEKESFVAQVLLVALTQLLRYFSITIACTTMLCTSRTDAGEKCARSRSINNAENSYPFPYFKLVCPFVVGRSAVTRCSSRSVLEVIIELPRRSHTLLTHLCMFFYAAPTDVCLILPAFVFVARAKEGEVERKEEKKSEC